jgi:hypothetical protein
MVVTTKLQALQAQYKAAIVGLELKIQNAQASSAKSAASSAASAAKAAAAEQKRIATLQAQLNTSTALLAIDKQIAAAKVDGDKAKLAELEYTRILEASELKIAEIRARGLSEAETLRQIKIEENKAEKQLLDTDTKRALERKKLEESFQTTVEALTIELDLAKAVTREEKNRLKLQQKRLQLEGKGFDDDQVQQILDLEKGLQAAQAPIQSYITQTQEWLNDTEAMIVSLGQSIETSISGSITGAVDALVTGSKTVQEVLSEMFTQIGRAFVNMAAEIIAKQLVMIALQGILKALGGGGGGGTFSQGLGIDGTLAGEGIFSGSGPYKFAEGGFVTGPTNAVVGEGGSNEYVIPENKMGSAMARWNAGARGDSVINGADGTGERGGAPLAEPAPQINISGGVMQFNDTNYIRQDQLPSIISQAGKQGEARAMRRLQMSSSTRRKLGI